MVWWVMEAPIRLGLAEGLPRDHPEDGKLARRLLPTAAGAALGP